MRIAEFLTKERILDEMSASDKTGALEELSEPLLAAFPRLDRGKVLRVLNEREALGSTAMEHGIAMPHGKIADLQAPALARMLAHLPPMHVEIETNGTTRAPPRLDIRIDQYNVSPKLAHSGNPAALALLPERLSAYAADPRAMFKFVIAAPGDVAEVLALKRAYAIPPARIFLMPEGTDSAALRARMEWLVPLCLEHGLRLSDRLHIHLFGDTRGT